MSKFDRVFNRLLLEAIGKDLTKKDETDTLIDKSVSKPTTATILDDKDCNPDNCYLWVKGKAEVYACMITDENVDAASKFLQKCKENPNVTAKPGKYLVYNPNISEAGGQVWMNKLQGYKKVTSEQDSSFKSLHLSQDGLEFDAYVFLPKENIEEMNDETDKWIGFQIPAGMTFKIGEGCGRNGSDGSTAAGTDWLPIKDGKFDWARSIESMKQSNFECKGKIKADKTPKLSEESQQCWDNAIKES